jgi:hypothetical protein
VSRTPEQAWEALCEALRRAGRAALEAPAPNGALDRAEAFRYLAGLAVSGLRQALELSDPDRPRFVRNPDSAAKWGAENADNQYLWARVERGRRYRIRGWRSTAFDFLIEVKEGYMQLGDARNFATLTAAEIACAADGSFEIALGGEPRPGNWLPLHEDARYVAIRQYFADWEREAPARFEIARVGGEELSPPNPSPESVAALLDSAGEWTETSARYWAEWVTRLRADHREGEIAAARGYTGGADAILYGNDLFRVGADEALLIETEVPQARYWAFQLCDLSFVTLDYANRQTSLNHAQARVDPDGRVRMAVAHRDPGVPNWLDCAGHAEGVIQYRWIWTRTNPRPRLRRLPLAALRRELPPGTPEVSAAERRRAIAARESHVARREPAT